MAVLCITAKKWDNSDIHQLMNRYAKHGLATPWNVIQQYKGMSDTGYNMGGPQKHYAKRNKPDTKGHTLDDSIISSVRYR